MRDLKTDLTQECFIYIAGMTVRVQVAIDAAANTENSTVQNGKPSPRPPPDLHLFGFDLTHLSPFSNLLVGSLGVFVCYLIYGILQVKELGDGLDRELFVIDFQICFLMVRHILFYTGDDIQIAQYWTSRLLHKSCPIFSLFHLLSNRTSIS